MKKILLVLALTACAMPARAWHFSSNPYIGFEYGYALGEYKEDYLKDSYEDKSGFWAVSIGMRASEYFGAEIFYQQLQTADRGENNIKTEAGYYAYGIDFIGFLPSPDLSFSLLASAGAGMYKLEGKYRSAAQSYDYDKVTTGMRLGLGMQYNMTQFLALRVMARYVLSDSEYLRNMYEFAGGVQITF